MKYRDGVAASVVISFENGRDCAGVIAGKIYHLCLLKVNNSGSLFKSLINPEKLDTSKVATDAIAGSTII